VAGALDSDATSSNARLALWPIPRKDLIATMTTLRRDDRALADVLREAEPPTPYGRAVVAEHLDEVVEAVSSFGETPPIG
jgi:hypothetical protein